MTFSSTEEDRLVRQYEPMCYKFAIRLHIDGMDEDDLLQEMRIAALCAIRDWEDGYGNSLTTHVFNGLALKSRQLLFLQDRKLNAKSGAGRMMQRRISLNDRLLPDDDSEEWIDVIPSDFNLEHEVIRREIVRQSRSIARRRHPVMLELLPELMSEGGPCSNWGYNLSGRGSLTEIGKRHGISRERVRQIKVALRKILSEDKDLIDLCNSV